jgi:hypothetical protein
LAATIIGGFFCDASFAEDKSITVSDKLVGEQIAPPKKIDVGTDLDFVSRYVWRGIYYSDGVVWQPSAWISKWGITPSVWANYVLNNERDQWKFNEVDLNLSYQYDLAGLVIKPGFIYYLYPYNVGNSTAEASVFLSYPIVSWLKAYTTQNFDIKQFKSAYYADLGLALSKEINQYISVQAQVSMAWASSKFNNAYYYVPKTAVNNVMLNLGMIAKPLPFLYVRPHLQYFVLTNKDIRKAFDTPNLFCVGVALGATY